MRGCGARTPRAPRARARARRATYCLCTSGCHMTTRFLRAAPSASGAAPSALGAAPSASGAAPSALASRAAAARSSRRRFFDARIAAAAAALTDTDASLAAFFCAFEALGSVRRGRGWGVKRLHGRGAASRCGAARSSSHRCRRPRRPRGCRRRPPPWPRNRGGRRGGWTSRPAAEGACGCVRARSGPKIWDPNTRQQTVCGSRERGDARPRCRRRTP